MPRSSSLNRPPQPRRADAVRNIERILDAAVEELAVDPEAGMAAVAQRAGVVRATLYVHYPTREALIAAVRDRAMAESAAAVRAAAPDDGEPREALARVLVAAWRMLGRYHSLVTIGMRTGHARDHAVHGPVVELLLPLIRRGQASGAFNADVPTRWLLTVSLDLIHAASGEVSAGRMSEDAAERALVASVLGAFSPPKRRRGANQRMTPAPPVAAATRSPRRKSVQQRRRAGERP